VHVVTRVFPCLSFHNGPVLEETADNDRMMRSASSYTVSRTFKWMLRGSGLEQRSEI
jgi:hypothetical protein